MSEEEKENLTEELEESETESSMVSDKDTSETIDESSEDTAPSNEGNVTTITPEQVKGYKRNITGLGIALGVLILLAALIVVALIVRGMNEDTTCSTDTCEVCEVCTENVESEIAPYTYVDAEENK